MADIFMSYATPDRERVRPIARALEARGWSVFWDHKIPVGKTWDQVIEREIDAARSVVVLWSDASARFDWVKTEAREGKSRGILIPVLVGQTAIPLEFRHLQTANLIGWTAADAHPEWEALMSELASLLAESPARETRPPEETRLLGGTAHDAEQPECRRKTEPPATEDAARLGTAETVEVLLDGQSAAASHDFHESVEPAPSRNKSRRVWALAVGAVIVILSSIAFLALHDTSKQETAAIAQGKSAPQEVAASAAAPVAPMRSAEESYREGNRYYLGTGVTRDYRKAAMLYLDAAEEGHASAQFSLGVMYEEGEGVTKDETEAAKWYRQAADQGNASAQNNLGLMYANGRGVGKNEAEAVKWYRKAADQANAQAQNNLGWMYANGLGVAKNEAEAVKWYRKAADQGNANAQRNLGSMYAEGRGIRKDEVAAVNWYRKAADQGLAIAQFALGLAYATGSGVAKNESEAARWWRMAADQGLPEAQFGLGLMYAKGLGVAKDDVEAVRWYRKAADQGNVAARSELRKRGLQ